MSGISSPLVVSNGLEMLLDSKPSPENSPPQDPPDSQHTEGPAKMQRRRGRHKMPNLPAKVERVAAYRRNCSAAYAELRKLVLEEEGERLPRADMIGIMEAAVEFVARYSPFTSGHDPTPTQHLRSCADGSAVAGCEVGEIEPLEVAGDLGLVIDLDGVVRFALPCCRRYFGHEDRLRGTYFLDHVASRDRSTILNLLMQGKQGRKTHFSCHCRDSNRQYRNVHFSAVPLDIDSEPLLLLIGWIDDQSLKAAVPERLLAPRELDMASARNRNWGINPLDLSSRLGLWPCDSTGLLYGWPTQWRKISPAYNIMHPLSIKAVSTCHKESFHRLQPVWLLILKTNRKGSIAVTYNLAIPCLVRSTGKLTCFLHFAYTLEEIAPDQAITYINLDTAWSFVDLPAIEYDEFEELASLASVIAQQCRQDVEDMVVAYEEIDEQMTILNHAKQRSLNQMRTLSSQSQASMSSSSPHVDLSTPSLRTSTPTSQDLQGRDNILDSGSTGPRSRSSNIQRGKSYLAMIEAHPVARMLYKEVVKHSSMMALSLDHMPLVRRAAAEVCGY